MKPSLASAPTVITCHSNADWDALSSMIGMSMIYPDSIMIFPGSMEKRRTGNRRISVYL